VNSSKSFGKIALDATLRAAALAASERSGLSIVIRNPAPDTRHPIPASALRFKLFKRKQGRLFIFAIDLSGSMALNRINQARDAMFGLLRQSYIHRDSVAIIGFRGLTAEVMLPPSKSILRARRVLESLPMGGGTPLSAGLACSLDLAKRVAATAGEMVLLIFTDGGANVSRRVEEQDNRELRQQIIDSEIAHVGLELQRSGVTTVLLDTQTGFRAAANTRKIAEALGARFVKL
jgi:magnesium chelatase subunit D